MQRRNLISTLAALQLIGAVGACPFHAQNDEPIPLNNHRRSLPGNCSRTAIEDIRIFNGWQFDPPQTLCFDSGHIVDTDGCDGADVKINGTGKFLIPGLIDSHVHPTDVQSLENFTSYGCTTAMRMNCDNVTQCEIIANQPGLASVLRAGMSAVGNGSLHEAQDPTRPKDTLIFPETNVTQFTEWQFNNGSFFHKITAELNGPSTQQQIEMVQVAHCQYQRQTMTHASQVSAYEQAVESVTDGIQHVPDDGILDDDTIQKIKSQAQFVTPTLNIFEFAYSTPAIGAFLGITPNSNRTLDHAETNAKLLYDAGVPIIAGTDAIGSLPMNGTVLNIPFGLTVHLELQHLVQIVGMSPAEAINAATREAAKWYRVPDRGSIEIGKRADLLMLNSDPLVNINNTQDVERVWVEGIEVSHVTKLT
ncbi:hypothetical protein MMC10_009126 [Thelotrema lepadinum]|nr:hypothetical protein [Thelotrema lepadinum]